MKSDGGSAGRGNKFKSAGSDPGTRNSGQEHEIQNKGSGQQERRHSPSALSVVLNVGILLCWPDAG